MADTEECARLVEAAETLGFSAYQNVVPRIDRIGVTAFEFHGRGDKPGYFRAAEHARTLQVAIFEQSFDPVARVMGLLREHVGVTVEVADEEHRVGAMYGFRDEIVAGAREAVIEPAVGDLYLFNTRNYHRMRPCEGQRVATSSACGVHPNTDAVVLWS
ncbi:MAG: hypothetical protein ACRDQ4_20185 [Pseudonocardiaceae bacterium]